MNGLGNISVSTWIIGILIIALAIYQKTLKSKKFRPGMEYGSARWGTKKDIKAFINPDYRQNIILTETERLTMEGRPKIPKNARNKNVIVIGDNDIIGLSQVTSRTEKATAA